MTQVSAAQVRAYRVRAQQLDHDHGLLDDTAVLDAGVQDTGPDGGLWALALRGVDVGALAPDALVTLWTLRGAPHLYRRADLPGVAAAVAPMSEADAAKRVGDAAQPLRAAGIAVLDALDAVAEALRAAVPEPTGKGVVSRRVPDALPEPYLRKCRPCGSTHLYEMPFRLAALRAGLELQPGTSPPVLAPVPGLVPAAAVPERVDVVRSFLRVLGPATPHQVAAHAGAPVADVRARWPVDAAPVSVDGRARSALPGAVDALLAGPVRGVRLLGPFDPFLQARDRETLVTDPVQARALWPVLGRPGGLLVDGRVVGTWRARRTGSAVRVTVEPFAPLPAGRRAEVEEQAERLSAFRGLRLAGVDLPP